MGGSSAQVVAVGEGVLYALAPTSAVNGPVSVKASGGSTASDAAVNVGEAFFSPATLPEPRNAPATLQLLLQNYR